MKTPLLTLGHKWLVSFSQETQNLSDIKSMAYFLSIYTLSDEFYNMMSVSVTFFPSILGVNHFPILGKIFPQSQLSITPSLKPFPQYPHKEKFSEWNGKITLWKCSSPLTPNLFDSVTSNNLTDDNFSF